MRLLPIGFSTLLCAMAAVVFLATAAPVRAQTSRIEAEVNNGAFSGTPDTVYKNSNFTLVLDAVHFFSRFQWGGTPVESAELYFYIYSYAGNATVSAYGVSPSYDPDTLNWNNQPGAGPLLGSTLVDSVGWFSIDVADYVNQQNGEFAIFLVNTSGSGNLVRSLPATDHIYIEYVDAPGTKPTNPLHCYNFDDNSDSIGTADFALQSGATLTSAAVVDTGIAVTSAQTAAMFPALATAANSGFTVAMWAQMNDTGDIYQLESADGDFRFLVEGGVRTQVDSPLGNNAWNANTGAAGWNFFAGGMSSGGDAFVMVNTAYYTDTISAPIASVGTLNLDMPDIGRADQIFWWGYALSRQELLWVWNGGRGRSCWEFAAPSQIITYTISIPQPTPAYSTTLPFGGVGEVHMQATIGDVFLIIAVGLLATISLAVVLRDVAHRSAAK